ncbi:MAG: ABC transporter ATP-binding protein [Paracoccaceae bacterium]
MVFLKLVTQGFHLLTPERQREAVFIAFGLVLAAAVEMLAMASILPFLGVLVNPGLIEQAPFLGKILDVFGATSINQSLVFLGVTAAVLFFVSACFRAWIEIKASRFTQYQRHELALRILTRVVARPYDYFLNRNASEIIKTVLGDVDRVVHFVLQPTVFLMSQATQALAVFLLVLFVAPGMTLIATSSLIVFYLGAFLLFRGRTALSGAKLTNADKERYKVAAELLRNIKALRIAGREDQFLDDFSAPSETVALQYAANHMYSRLPRLFIEALAIGGVILLSAAFVLMNGGVTSASLGETLPAMALLALAGLRMLPLAQVIFQSGWNIQLGAASAEKLRQELEFEIPDRKVAQDAWALTHEISVRDLSFKYEGSDSPAFEGVSFTLEAGKSLAIVGPTGVGKSTLLDVLLGLHSPSSGEISIDGRALTSQNAPSWQATIGYVPQVCDLLDASIERNIVYGEALDLFDQERLNIAVRDAQLDETIARQPNGIKTLVGEAGVRLSGGEKQRILIARAVYRKATVIILDEPTSALDSETESRLGDVVRGLTGNRTVLVVTHQENIAEGCDQLLRLRPSIH